MILFIIFNFIYNFHNFSDNKSNKICVAVSRVLRRNCWETSIVIVVMASPMEILKEMNIVYQAMRDINHGNPDPEIGILIQELSALLIELEKKLNIPYSEEVIDVNTKGG